MTLYINLAGIFMLALVASILAMFFNKSRPVAKFLLVFLTAILVVAVITVLYFRRPMEFEKHYVNTALPLETLLLNKRLQQAGMYLGAPPRNANQLDSHAYRHVFNSITPENDLKLGHLLDIETLEYDFTQADALVTEAIKRNIRVRGHALVWGKLSDIFNAPDLDLWLSHFPELERTAKLTHLLDLHITSVLNHYQGKILEWDVVNEPLEMFGRGQLEKNVFYRHLGEEYIERAFFKAKAIDPELQLYLNEQFFNYTDQRAEAFYQLVMSLLNKGVPIDGIGLQGHMVFHLATPEETAAYVKRFTSLGLKVQITEFEARLRLFSDAQDPYQAQGEYYRDVMRICYEIDGFDGITFWGVDDSISWLDDMSWLFPKPNEAYLLDAQQRAKPGLILIDQWLKAN